MRATLTMPSMICVKKKCASLSLMPTSGSGRRGRAYKRQKRREQLTDAIEELSAGAILQEDELPEALQPGSVAFDDVQVVQQLVHANLLLHGVLSHFESAGSQLNQPLFLKKNDTNAHPQIDFFHGAGLSRLLVDQQLDLREGALAQDLFVHKKSSC